MAVCQCNPTTRMGISGMSTFLKQGNGRRDFATQSVVKKRHTALALYDVK